jgi:hypothetical protein
MYVLRQDYGDKSSGNGRGPMQIRMFSPRKILDKDVRTKRLERTRYCTGVTTVQEDESRLDMSTGR